MARNFEYYPATSGGGRSKRRAINGPTKQSSSSTLRSKLILFCLYSLMVGVAARLYYWQVIHHERLQGEAEQQYRRTVMHQGKRGRILTKEGYPLVTNAPVYRLFAQPHLIKKTPQEVSELLGPLLIDVTPELA